MYYGKGTIITSMRPVFEYQVGKDIIETLANKEKARLEARMRGQRVRNFQSLAPERREEQKRNVELSTRQEFNEIAKAVEDLKLDNDRLEAQVPALNEIAFRANQRRDPKYAHLYNQDRKRKRDDDVEDEGVEALSPLYIFSPKRRREETPDFNQPSTHGEHATSATAQVIAESEAVAQAGTAQVIAGSVAQAVAQATGAQSTTLEEETKKKRAAKDDREKKKKDRTQRQLAEARTTPRGGNVGGNSTLDQ
jgi:hypothetical protein